MMLRCNTENVSGDSSNFEKHILTSEVEKYSVLREGILSRKKLTSGSWLLPGKSLLFEKGLKLTYSKFGSGAIMMQLNLNAALNKRYQFIFQNPLLNSNSSATRLLYPYHNVILILSTPLHAAPSFLYRSLQRWICWFLIILTFLVL